MKISTMWFTNFMSKFRQKRLSREVWHLKFKFVAKVNKGDWRFFETVNAIYVPDLGWRYVAKGSEIIPDATLRIERNAILEKSHRKTRDAWIK